MKINCPICNSEMTLFATTKDLQVKSSEEMYSAYECMGCNFLFQYPFWTPGETSRFYETNYYAHTETSILPRSIRILDFFLEENFTSKMLPSFIRKKLYPYYEAIRNSKRVLDVGCGKGLFLDLMKKYNKETYGLEPGDNAKAIALKKGHTMIDKSSIGVSGETETLKFDLITMFQVAEHLSVQEVLKENLFSRLCDSLEHKGYLIIETPNYECKYSKDFMGDWRALELPRHLIIFSPKGISKMLTDAGFVVKVFTRISPFDVKESLKLRYKTKSIQNYLLGFFRLCKIAVFQKKNSSMLVVVAQKI